MSAEIVEYPSLKAISVGAPAFAGEGAQAGAGQWPLGRRLRLMITLAVLAWMLVGGIVWVIVWAIGLL